jgi:Ion channel
MRFKSVIAERRFLILFIAILFDWLVYPLLESTTMAKTLLGSFSLAILLSALFSVTGGRRLRRLALALGVPAVGATVLEMLSNTPGVSLANDVLVGSFLLLVTIVVLRAVLAAVKVTSEVVNGALCVYLLFGFVFSATYVVLETIHPGSFAMSMRPHDGPGLHRAFLYFSYVTQTTMGYGDITPVTPLARSLATVQAIAGQLYLAVLVARLVALQIVDQERA